MLLTVHSIHSSLVKIHSTSQSPIKEQHGVTFYKVKKLPFLRGTHINVCPTDLWQPDVQLKISPERMASVKGDVLS